MLSLGISKCMIIDSDAELKTIMIKYEQLTIMKS